MTFRARIAATVAIAASLALGATAHASAACPGADLSADRQTPAALELSLLCLINEQRSAAGLGTLAPNAQLRVAALAHSGDMVRRGYFDHASHDGRDFIDRIVATGYTRKTRQWVVGENLAWGSGGMSTPSSLVQAWMDSPSHRENLMRARFREIGLGAVTGTPQDAGDAGGITVASEFGYRVLSSKSGRKATRRAKAARRAKARARARAARR
jgi:uncharacterized protein YkwD